MKNKFLVATLIFIGMMSAGCDFAKVEAGNVGVKVYLLGTSKGVDSEVLTPGRYWIGFNEDLYLFPVFQQTVLWSDDGNKSDAFSFQTKEGMVSRVDVSVSYTVNKDKVHILFQKYRKGIEEITDIYLRNVIRDAIAQVASQMTVEEAYGERKQELQDSVVEIVRGKMQEIGINIDYIAFVGGVRPPDSVINAINAKVAAKQRAQQRENEIKEAEAQAKKQEALAKGEANARIQEARGRAEAIQIEAEAQARANQLISQSVTETLIQYRRTEKWDGKLPTVTGNNQPLIDMRTK